MGLSFRIPGPKTPQEPMSTFFATRSQQSAIGLRMGMPVRRKQPSQHLSGDSSSAAEYLTHFPNSLQRREGGGLPCKHSPARELRGVRLLGGTAVRPLSYLYTLTAFPFRIRRVPSLPITGISRDLPSLIPLVVFPHQHLGPGCYRCTLNRRLCYVPLELQ